MTVTHAFVMAATVLGFAALLVTLLAFVRGRERLGFGLLVVSGVVFIVALVGMARLSTWEQGEARNAVMQKYRAHIQQWGAPLGVSPQWEVNGEIMGDCAVNLDHPDDPVMTCDGKELPLRH